MDGCVPKFVNKIMVVISIFLKKLVNLALYKASYEYKPIESEAGRIRLLTILPAQSTSIAPNNQKDAICCTLETVTLSDAVSYDALSYTWGPWGTDTISISGRTLPVTSNLYAALRQLRDDHHSTHLWIDAICINQANKDEKRAQIPLMGPIYESATSVIVWLGPAADDSDSTIDELSRVGKKSYDAKVLDIDSSMLKVLFKPDPDEQRAAVEKGLQQLSDEVGFEFPFRALDALTKRVYWRRVWIVQEVVLAREIVILCGHKKIPYRYLAAGVRFIDFHCILLTRTIASRDPDEYSDTERGRSLMANDEGFLKSASPNSGLTFLVNVRDRYQKSKVRYTLFDLLTRGCIIGSAPSQREATDPKDMIYGLLGLASDRADLKITADYRASTIPAQVYTSVTRCLLECNNTDVLTWCQPNTTLDEEDQELSYLVPPCWNRLTAKQSEHPSWVPDFSTPIREPCGETRKAAIFKASGTTKFDCQPIDPAHPIHFSMTGVEVDKITSLGPHWKANLSEPFDLATAAKFFAAIEEFCVKSQKCKFPMPEDAKWRIPCADQQHDPYRGRIRTTPSVAAEGYRDLKKRIVEGQQQNDEGGRYQRAMSYLHHRRPAILEGGRVGLVPAHAEPDDLVCVILGVHVPFVLRETRHGLWELIGEAFVYGIMDGEVVEKKFTPRVFVLC